MSVATAPSSNVERAKGAPAVEHLPWALIAASLISFGALYFTGERFNSVLVLGALVLTSAFVQWRLPGGALWGWMIRAALFAMIFLNYRLPDRRDMGGWYVDPGVMKLAGLLLAAELTLRVWQLRRAARLAREVLLLATCVMATSAVTYESQATHVFAPMYAIAIILSTRSMAAMTTTTSPRPTPGLRSIATKATAIGIALAIGYAAVFTYDKLMYQLDSWAVRLLTLKAKGTDTIGFSTSHELLPMQDPEPSMTRVLLIDGKMYEPHVRVMAFDTYTNGQWRPFENDRNFQAFSSSPAPAPSAMLRFTQLENTASLLPVPLSAAAVNSNDALEMDELASLRDASGNNGLYDVAAVKTPDYQGPICVAPSAEERERLLRIPPELDRKVVALARQVAGVGDAEHRVARIENYLRSHHTYSLTFIPQGEPLNDFILHDRAAHCQYFASALVVMARAVGVPARYVGGFYAHETEGPDQTVVRERDAHAWAECWIDGVGWTTLDATPSGGRPDQIYPNSPGLRLWWEKIVDGFGAVRRWLANLFGHLTMMLAVAIIVPLAIIIVQNLRRRRRVATNAAYANPDARLVDVGRQFESWLARRGVVCPPDRPWTDCIATLEDHDSPRRFVALYNEARFGGKAAALDDAIDLLKQLESETGNTAQGNLAR